MYHYRRGPRRIFWFILGGVAATIWLKGREKERGAIDCSDERPWGWWKSRRYPVEETETEKLRSKRWKEERERIAQLGSQASETAADVSEAALDTILSTVQALKLKLAEHREIREKPAQENTKEFESRHV